MAGGDKGIPSYLILYAGFDWAAWDEMIHTVKLLKMFLSYRKKNSFELFRELDGMTSIAIEIVVVFKEWDIVFTTKK